MEDNPHLRFENLKSNALRNVLYSHLHDLIKLSYASYKEASKKCTPKNKTI